MSGFSLRYLIEVTQYYITKEMFMKMKKSHKTKGLSIVLTAAMVISSMTAPATGSAAKKVSMSGHTEVQVGKKVILRLKNNKKTC